jgi:hypothetical protein
VPPSTVTESHSLSFHGISFADSRLDRVALLKGPFSFTQFERAELMGLFVNINDSHVNLDFSRFTEIECETTHRPCLRVQQDTRTKPLRLNLLWSKLVTDLRPKDDDKFICSPSTDVPAWVAGKLIKSSGYWVWPPMPNDKHEPLECPGNSSPGISEGPKQSHVLFFKKD